MNNFGFSLYTILSVYYLVATSDIEWSSTERNLIEISMLT